MSLVLLLSRDVPATLPVTETWTGATGADWPPSWTFGGFLTRSIQSGRGRLTTDGGAYVAASAYLLDMPATTDTETAISYVPFSSEHYVYVGGRSGSAAPAPNPGFPDDGVGLQLGFNGSTWQWQHARLVDGVRTILSSGTYPALTAGALYRVRVRLVGAMIHHRIWLAASQEPEFWDGTSTDASPYLAAGRLYLGVQSGAPATPATIDFDDLTVAAASASAYAPGQFFSFFD